MNGKLKKIVDGLVCALYGRKALKAVPKADGNDMARLRAMIGEASYEYLKELHKGDERTVNTKLRVLAAAMTADTPFIFLSKSPVEKAGFVSFFGTPEEVGELKAQEYTLDFDYTEDNIPM